MNKYLLIKSTLFGYTYVFKDKMSKYKKGDLKDVSLNHSVLFTIKDGEMVRIRANGRVVKKSWHR